MNISRLSKLASICLLIVAAGVATPSFAMDGDTIADIVLGQPNFTATPQNFVDGHGLDGPIAVAIDKSVVPNRLYISDSVNNRVLGYKNVATLVNGGFADLVIGQPSFNSNSCNAGGLSAGSLCVPDGVAVDASGNLYVTDQNNNRVLEYNTPFAGCGSFPCVGAPANRVFGQGGSFNSATCNNGGTSANSLCGPFGVALDSLGNLYVADSNNNRVLEYNTPLTTDTTADRVFGQGGFFFSGSCNLFGISANSLCNPFGISLDASGNLYVADQGNKRVLEYNTPLTTDTTADTVFGQLGSFTSNTCWDGGSPSASNLCMPYGVAVDASGNVYIADYHDNRILEYNTPLTTDTIADRVVGQGGSFTTVNFACCSAGSLFHPAGLAFDSSGNLYAADYGENRVLQYQTPLVVRANADLVIGQNGFTTDNFNLPATNASTFNDAEFVALDTSVVPNRLYVADVGNNRVLGWKDVTAISNDSPADLVIGQPDFVSSACNNGGVSAASLCGGDGVAVDGSGNLYVGDTGNHRVLEYNTPFAACASFPCVGGPANLVFGQSSFTSNFCNSPGVSAATMCEPGGLAVDADGNLYVADPSNNRVLEYNTPLTTDTTADLVFGQGGSFTSQSVNNGGVTANSMGLPDGVAVDPNGNLFVADVDNNRVLEFDSPTTTDTTADRVYGQPDFVSSTCNNGGVNANSECAAFGVGLDSQGNLYVSDYSNNRLLEYNNPLSNPTADLVFGQGGNFGGATCNNGGISASSICQPLGVAADTSGNLYLADRSNGRILVYDNPLGLTTTATPTATATATATATPTATATATATASATATSTATATATATDTATPTATATDTAIATATSTATATATPTATPTTSMTVTASLAFGNVAVGQTLMKTIIVHNTGATHPLVVSNAIPSGSEYFLSGTGTCGAIPITVAPKTNCTMGVSFMPGATGAHNASIAVSDNATTSPQHVTLTGAGIAGMTLSKSSLVFGSVKFGIKAVLSFSVINHQTQSVGLNESFSGTNSADFSISGGTCTANLGALKSCSIIVTFTPGALGTESASLSVSDTPDPLAPYAVALSTGPTIPASVLPATLAYGTLTSKVPSKTLKTTVTNLSGFPLPLSENISGPNAIDFAAAGSGTCGATAEPHSSCTIAVTFTPTGGGSAESATMAVSVGSDPTGPHNIALTGTGP